jgi:hypothetical protein
VGDDQADDRGTATFWGDVASFEIAALITFQSR